MNRDSLVSVIVPIYNAEQYLCQCLDSILCQTYSNLEIILVDDGSTDNCLNVCTKYKKKDSRVVVVHQENRGVSAARNSGIEYSHGEYISFVDSDDELHSNAIEILLNDMTLYGADISVATKSTVKENGEIISIYDDGTFSFYDGTDLICMSLDGDRQTGSVVAKLFKKSFIGETRFFEGKRVNEDGFFLFQNFVKQPKVIQHNVCVYKYIVRQNSASRDQFSEKYFDMLFFCQKKKEIIDAMFPQLTEKAYNMEVRTNLLFLQVLCRTTDKKYKEYERRSIKTIKELHHFFVPSHNNERKIVWIIVHNLFQIYKRLINIKSCLKHSRGESCEK